MQKLLLSRRHAVLAGGALLLSGAAARAAAPAAAPAAPSGADQDAIAPIRALNAGLIRIMRAGKATPFDRRFDMLAPEIDRAFDLPRILAVSVGEGWARLAAAEQTALLAAFRRYTVASYVENFDSFDGQRIDLAPATRPVPGGAQVVLTTIVAPSGERHQIDYVMRKTDSGWKAVDVLADGSISRVAVQRSDFRQLLDHGGAPALVGSLTRKAEALARG
ncbi:MAG: ABC transporter substrate-binding protein [Rhodospirillales bacterium]|nr:ABC transporter substrate-binding protein [Rhodospirillales bacterium]